MYDNENKQRNPKLLIIFNTTIPLLQSVKFYSDGQIKSENEYENECPLVLPASIVLLGIFFFLLFLLPWQTSLIFHHDLEHLVLGQDQHCTICIDHGIVIEL